MDDMPAAREHSYDRRTVRSTGTARKAQPGGRRSRTVDAGRTVLRIAAASGCMAFLVACAWAIASNG